MGAKVEIKVRVLSISLVPKVHSEHAKLYILFL